MDSLRETMYVKLQKITPIPESEWKVFRELCSLQTIAK